MQLGYRVEKFATGLRGGCGIFAETNSAILWKKNISPDMSMSTNMSTGMSTTMNMSIIMNMSTSTTMNTGIITSTSEWRGYARGSPG